MRSVAYLSFFCRQGCNEEQPEPVANQHGDSEIHLPFVSAAVRGQSTEAYVSTGTMPMGKEMANCISFHR